MIFVPLLHILTGCSIAVREPNLSTSPENQKSCVERSAWGQIWWQKILTVVIVGILLYWIYEDVLLQGGYSQTSNIVYWVVRQGCIVTHLIAVVWFLGIPSFYIDAGQVCKYDDKEKLLYHLPDFGWNGFYSRIHGDLYYSAMFALWKMVSVVLVRSRGYFSIRNP